MATLTTQGSSQTFSYTGGVQTFSVTRKGIYRMEVWGGSTSIGAMHDNNAQTAKGGYASGYKKITSGTLYIVCGGNVTGGTQGDTLGGAYNGGGSACGYWDDVYGRYTCQPGAGATHIASVTGLLKNIDSSKVYIVAGGAGGNSSGTTAQAVHQSYAGGAGGNSASGSRGQGGSTTKSSTNIHGCGGGGGWNGGAASASTNVSEITGGGGGGSSYTGSVPSFTYAGTTYSPSTTAGNRTGAGQAKITLTKIIWDVSLSQNISAAGTVSGSGEVANGSSVTVTATVNTGYTFLGWYLGDTRKSTNTSYTFTPTADTSLEARYVKRYTLTLNVSPSGSGTVSGGGTYDSGTSVTITATRATGYLFDGWYNGSTLISSNSSYTFNIASTVTYTAKFVTSYTISTSMTPSGAGTITQSTEYKTGASATIKVSAVNPGYIFSGWYLNNSLVTSNTSYTLTVSGNASYEARFIVSSVSTSIRAGGTCAYNATVNPVVFTATASTHYTFVKYIIETSAGTITEYTDNPLTYTVPNDVSWVVCTVIFQYDFDWIPVITDRTQEDINNRTDKAFLNASDLNRIEKDVGYLQDAYGLELNIKVNWTYSDGIRQSDMTRILQDLATLELHYEGGQEITIPQNPINTYQKVNSLEKVLEILYNDIEGESNA